MENIISVNTRMKKVRRLVMMIIEGMCEVAFISQGLTPLINLGLHWSECRKEKRLNQGRLGN